MKKTKIDWCDSTWNPVTGCEHHCEYCVSGDTPVIMSDKTLKKISEVKVGDKILGVKKMVLFGSL